MAEVLGGNGRAAKPASIVSIRRYTHVGVRLTIALVGLMALLLAACGPDSGSGPVLAKSQTFTWPYNGTAQISACTQPCQPANAHGEVFDPAVTIALEDTGTLNMLYSGLVTLKSSDLTVQPDAATWEVDSTGTVYTFHLKHNLHFSDGTPLTASDYAYSIDRALDPNLCTVLDAKSYGPQGSSACIPIGQYYLSMILGASDRISGAIKTMIGRGSNDQTHGLVVVDPYTLQIRLDKPRAYFLDALTYPTSFPVERSLVEKYPGGLWVDHLDEGGASGPFKVLSYGGGKNLKLVPNTYWEAAWQKLTITEVDRPAFASQDDEYTAYNKGGQFDYTDVPAEAYSLARTQDDFNEVPALFTRYFGLNFDKPPFDNVLIRRAFDLALNKQILVDRILNGAASPTNHIIPRGMPGFDPNLINPKPDLTQSLTGNPVQAVKLIQDAAQQCNSTTTAQPYDYCPYITQGAKSLEIDVVYNSTSTSDHDVTTAAASDWAAVLGLNVKAVPSGLSQNAYFNKLVPGNSYQAWSVGWAADYPDPQDWTSLQFTTGAGNNASDVRDPNLDNLMAAADKDPNQADRMAKYNQIEQDLVNLVPWIPYEQSKAFWRQRSWVHGFGLNSLGTMQDVTWPNVYITQH
jgi:oligopeptide transport system substrate-binding protein